MRDTRRLRRRIRMALTCAPLAASVFATAGCDESTREPRRGDGEAEGKAPEGDEKADARSDEKAEKTDDKAGAKNANAPANQARWIASPDDEFDYFAPGRDPWAEHDEEAGCPNGDWCGSPEDARLFSVPNLDEQLGCPQKIIANKDSNAKVDQKNKKWKDFSFHPMMQGRFEPGVTKETRASGDATTCCYHWFEYCSGRPLFDEDEQLLAELRPGGSWMSELGSAPAPELNERVRERIAAQWLEDARMEHAAIGAFARACLELMSLGAPPELLTEAQRASLDEIAHTRTCLSLARRWGAPAMEPEALPTPPPREADWARLAVDTFVEGCVGETVAALLAERAAGRCVDPVTCDALVRIADDEARHAAFAWRTVSWILDGCGAERERVVSALQAAARALSPTPQVDQVQDPDVEAMSVGGRLDAPATAQARHDAWREIIEPTLDELLAAPTGTRAARV